MRIDCFLDKEIEKRFKERNDKEQMGRTPSGKLSASMLNDPLQWQVLKILGVPPREFDEYTLRKFFRGKQIEGWIISEIPDVVEKQKLVEYQECIGFVDALVDTHNWDFKLGIIPLEVKSVANARFKRIIGGGGADHGHILQACYYALGLGISHFAVVYVASDDLRIQTYIYETDKYVLEIQEIIKQFQKKILQNEVPTFEARESWQSNIKYSKYPDWQGLNQEEINTKVMQFKESKRC